MGVYNWIQVPLLIILVSVVFGQFRISYPSGEVPLCHTGTCSRLQVIFGDSNHSLENTGLIFFSVCELRAWFISLPFGIWSPRQGSVRLYLVSNWWCFLPVSLLNLLSLFVVVVVLINALSVKFQAKWDERNPSFQRFFNFAFKRQFQLYPLQMKCSGCWVTYHLLPSPPLTYLREKNRDWFVCPNKIWEKLPLHLCGLLKYLYVILKIVEKPQIQREHLRLLFYFKSKGRCTFFFFTYLFETWQVENGGKPRTIKRRKWLHVLPIASWTSWIKQKQLECQMPCKFLRLV